ncbi:MAG: hydrogenase 3 maturation endopeptidase HyCI [Candidatus Omnitrophota bacterium]|jgi:hydrogenase 3 maturation protease
MNDILTGIKEHLKSKLAIVGIGNMLKGDDQVGPLLIQRLQGKTDACLFDCGQVPENYVQPIIETAPQTIFIIDAADWGGLIGELRLIKKEEVKNFSFSTHNASLGLFWDYLKNELPLANIIIIGIQVGKRDLMQSLSPEVESSLNQLVNFFTGCK